MAISIRLSEYLHTNAVSYNTVAHNPTFSSVNSALEAHVPIHQLVKAVILEDHEGRHLMAILPASHKINMHKLGDDLCRSLHLAKEKQVYRLFNDCEQGAIPGLGDSYNIDVVFDDLLDQQRDIYLEGCDISTLVHLKQAEFHRLMAGH
ncbi:MAG: YbaK/EbsC family protein, partial [Algicola sp.]|nr:YbaK/EbsC family protein [Algicola sp.]